MGVSSQTQSMNNSSQTNPTHLNIPDTSVTQGTTGNYQPQNNLANGSHMAGLAAQNNINGPSHASVVTASKTLGQTQVNSSNSSGSRTNSDRQQVLRHQQQRLLLLRHAAKCPHEDGRCPVTPHCAGMKRLWKHIAECKDQKCLVPHCVSSRYVLSHYHRCKDVRCPVCGPVREAIHRSHEKQRQMQALKQSHRDALNTVPAPVPNSSVTAPKIFKPNLPAPAPATTQNNLPVPSTSNAPVSSSLVPSAVTTSIQPPNPISTPVAATNVPVSSSSQVLPQNLPPTKRPKLEANPVPSVPVLQSSSTSNTAAPRIISQNPQPNQVPSNPLSVINQSTPDQTEKPQTVKSESTFQQGVSTVSNSIQPTTQEPIIKGSKAIKPSVPKPQEDHTLINCFTVEQIETHIASLNRGLQLSPQKLKVTCSEVLKVLSSHTHGWVFNSPVNPVDLGLPDYFQVIKHPMDLGTIKKKLDNNCYNKINHFESDVNLTFDNAMLYNPENSVVYNMAKEMKDIFTVDYKNLIDHLQEEENEKRKKGDACALCGALTLNFEPPIFYCNGPNCPCPGTRISRNRYYYVGGNNQYHWCQQCYNDLKDNQDITIVDQTLKKSQLIKKKNDEQPEESWVQCDKCLGWIHQICGLFNTRQNKDQRSEYTCPRCMIEDRKKAGKIEGSSTTPMAEDLQRTKLSEYLENHVRLKVNEYFEDAAVLRSKAENKTMEEARKGLEMGGPITIRQVTSMDRRLEVRERMKKRYKFKNYPSEFTFRCKCFVVFQNLDGVDVILFALYVYEHDEKNPAPNTRAVYISYLDSVHYMRPRKMRTYIYHEILISYLDYVRQKGFATAHIWACPPLKGDDYILYAKPNDQKTPRDDRLRQWYIDMLVEAQKRGIVGKVTNMFDLYFANPKNDATVVPYMDGDYFPGQVENIIKEIEEGKNSKKSSADGKKKKSKSKSKTKSGRSGTRSGGLDEDTLAASGIMPAGYDQKSLEEGGNDYVMAKLGESIKPMKESFIVAYLAWEGASEEQMKVPKDITEYRQKHGITSKNLKLISKTEVTDEGEKKDSSDPNKDTKKDEGKDDKNVSSVSNPVVKKSEDEKNGTSNESVMISNQNGSNSTNPLSSSSDDKNVSQAPVSSGLTVIRDGKFAAMAARKRDIDGKTKVNTTTSSSSSLPAFQSTVKNSNGRLVKVLDDDLEEMDCEFLNNRQAFLNLCQGNHYQFDQVRRAKHSSMMVLWHLHNRDAPKFVQQCAECHREILTGHRYHCQICGDYDQCQECHSNPKTPKHKHTLKTIAVGQQSAELTEKQRKDRQRSIQLHMNLLNHAATCTSKNCTSANCSKMKGLLKHGLTCQVKVQGGCSVCKRIWALLQIHARQCKLQQCPVQHCMAIRERFRQLTKQQQAMDDRRRQEMNRHYHTSSK